MGIDACFAADRGSGRLDDARKAMWAWAEPIVIDRAVEVYGRTLGATGTIAMARTHCKLWRALLLDQPAAGHAATIDDLHDAATDLGLGAAQADTVNDLILEELLDIVMSRYRSSRNATKAFSLVLMSATSRLGADRGLSPGPVRAEANRTGAMSHPA